jgi:hypothetical protein
MKARDSLRVSVLRSTLAAVANAEAVDVIEVAGAVPTGDKETEVTRRTLSEGEIREIVSAERLELASACEEMGALGQTREAEDLAVRAEILASYLASGRERPETADGAGSVRAGRAEEIPPVTRDVHEHADPTVRLPPRWGGDLDAG